MSEDNKDNKSKIINIEDVFEKPDETKRKIVQPQKEDPELKVEIEKYLDEVKKEVAKPKRKNNVSEEGKKVMLANKHGGKKSR
jgi:hypothetical protein